MPFRLQNLRWAFGISGYGTTHSLATAKRDHVFYVSSHTAVIHDPHTDTQTLLQGHVTPAPSPTSSVAFAHPFLLLVQSNHLCVRDT